MIILEIGTFCNRGFSPFCDLERFPYRDVWVNFYKQNSDKDYDGMIEILKDYGCTVIDSVHSAKFIGETYAALSFTDEAQKNQFIADYSK